MGEGRGRGSEGAAEDETGPGRAGRVSGRGKREGGKVRELRRMKRDREERDA